MKKALQQEDRVEASEGELRVIFPAEEQRENKKAAASKGQEPCRVTLPLEASGADLEETLVNYFSSHPLELAVLLQGGEPSLASDLLPPEPPWAQGRAPECTCGEAGCTHAAEAAALAAVRWKASPSLRLTALGLPPQRLRSAVFAAWASSAPAGGAELPAPAGRRGQGGSPAEHTGPALAEWLAEAAEQDRLHVPGPQFHDVKITLTPEKDAAPEASPDAGAWARLLPGIPGAAEAVQRIRSHTAERARGQAAHLSGSRRLRS